MTIRPRIVLADDIPALLNAWGKLLESTCIIVAKASDGPTALDAIRQFKPDAAVLDIQMPGLTGIDVAKNAIADQPHLGIVLCSVMRDRATVQAAAEIGVRGYVPKTDAVRELARAVAAVAAGGCFPPNLFDLGIAAVAR